MNSVERVKAICKERGIPLSHLEKACGFANAYISQLKKGTFPEDRLRKIADYLGLSPEYLATGTEPEGYYLNEATAKAAQELFENPDLRFLFDAARDSRPEDLRMAAEMLRRFKNSNSDETE